MLGTNTTMPQPRLYDAAVSSGTILTLAWAGFLVRMSHRTAATALLLASLPYGLALPQVIPFLSGIAPNVTPRPLPLFPAVNASTVAVVGTVVEPAVESAVDDVTDVIEDATETAASALESATNATSNALPTDVPSVLDPEANILPLILPGILPIETDLPPLETPDVIPSDLPILDPGIGNGTLLGDGLPGTNVTVLGDDLPDTNDLEVIDLPAPGEEGPYDDDDLTAPLPYTSDFPEGATVPISTFNAVVQPLLSVIQTLLNSLPGNYAPPVPGILPHPLLPTETPDIFIDPILPTETLEDAPIATSNGTINPLAPLVDPVSQLTDSVATDLAFAKRFAKRQELTDAGLTTNIIIELLDPIIEVISALLDYIPIVGPAVADAIDAVEDAVKNAVPTDLPVDIPAIPVDAPALPIPKITLPNLLAPILPTDVSDALDVLLTGDLPADVPALPLPELSAPSLPAGVSAIPVDPTDLTSGIPDEILNVPIPDIEGIDWASFESPPFWDPPAVSAATPGALLDAVSDVASAASAALPTSFDAFGDWDIPDDILNFPFPELDADGIPIDTPVNAVSSAIAAAPITLPTSLDAFDDLDDVLDWPFGDIPETIAPDVNGELPDLTDLPILDDRVAPIDLPAPALPTAAVAGLLLPAPAFSLPFPSDLLRPALPTGLFDVPVPVGFENIAEVPAPTAPSAPRVPALEDAPIPWDILNVPVPDFDEFGNPLDLPVAPTGLFANAPLPTGFLDVPVPDWFDDVGDALDLPAPALPPDAFGPGFPIQALPDVPLVLPSEGLPTDALPSVPTEALLPAEGLPSFPTDALTGLTAVATDALSGLPTGIPADVLSAPALPTDAPRIPSLPISSVVGGLPAVAPLLLPLSDLDELTNGLSALSTTSLPAVGDLTNGLPAVRNLTSNVGNVASTVTGAVPAVPGIAETVSSVTNAAPRVPNIASLLSGLPAGPISRIRKRQLSGLTSLLSSAAPRVPGVGGVVSSATGGVPGIGGLLADTPDVPNLASIAPAATGLPIVGGVASTVTNAAGGVPVVGGAVSTVTNAVGGVPVVGGAASIVASAVPKVPLAFDSGLTKTPLPTSDVPDTNQIVRILQELSTLISSLLEIVSAPVSTVTSSLPVSGPTPLAKRQIGLLGIDQASLPAALAPISSGVDTDALLALVQSLLRVVGQLVANLPIPGLQQLDLINALGNLGKRQLSDVAGALPLSTVASTVPLNTVTDAAAPLKQAALAILPSLIDLLQTLISTLPEPVKTPATAVASTVIGAATPLTGVAAGLAKTLPFNVPLIRRAVEEFQQGPASNWEAFLSELDRSSQGELHRLVHDSAKAVNNNDLESLTATLKKDFEDLSADTKAKIQSAAPVLANMQKRSMRHGKRQSAIPGAQSIGPNLDDAEKVDLSFLGKSGSLNPFGQPLGGVAPAPLADDVSEVFRAPSPIIGELADSSIDIGISPEAAAILKAGGLDPYGMKNPNTQLGSPVDDTIEQDPYADLRPLKWDPALDQGAPKQALEGLDATLQAAKGNKFTERPPKLSFAPTFQSGSAAASQAAAKGAQEQGEVLRWFHRVMKPSGNKDVDAEVVG